MIETIAHLADIHIEKSVKRHDEYNNVLTNFCESIKKTKPDRVVIAGDLFDNKLEISNEMNVLAKNYIKQISKYTQKIIIIRGNHDLNIKNVNRIDTINALYNLIDVDNFYYLDKSGFYIDENVLWVLHDHVDKQNPWIELKKNHLDKTKHFKNLDGSNIDFKIQKDTLTEFLSNYKKIDLYHNPVQGSIACNGEEMNSERYRKIGDFYGDILMLGDIHKKQFFYK